MLVRGLERLLGRERMARDQVERYKLVGWEGVSEWE